MSTATPERKTSRIDLRMTDEQKRQIESAAALCGTSVSQWSIDRLLDSARSDIARARTTALSSQAFDEFVRQLTEPVDPTFEAFAKRKSIWEA